MGGLVNTSDPSFEAAREEVQVRRLAYPLGSGQAEEIALGAGIKPLVRQLLDASSLDVALERFRRAGFHVVVPPVRYTGRGRARVTFTDGDAPSGAEAPVFVSRERRVAEAAAACEVDDEDEQPRVMGELLGYPPCCVEAFASTPIPRPNRELASRALARTAGALCARLNTLDQAMFHYIAYSTCSFDCAPSSSFADAVASIVHSRHPHFAAAIDNALGAHRLMLSDDVQVSIAGRLTGAGIDMFRVWPTAVDRRPGRGLGATAESAIVELLLALRRGRVLAVTEAGVLVDGALLEGTAGALLVPFGQ